MTFNIDAEDQPLLRAIERRRVALELHRGQASLLQKREVCPQ
ncbi:hypothetical protein C4K26_5672 [Pseudomonas chlororaphis]|nr:hypothetical protein C4K26_5672 [Pseudomonas chlororaphis]